MWHLQVPMSNDQYGQGALFIWLMNVSAIVFLFLLSKTLTKYWYDRNRKKEKVWWWTVKEKILGEVIRVSEVLYYYIHLFTVTYLCQIEHFRGLWAPEGVKPLGAKLLHCTIYTVQDRRAINKFSLNQFCSTHDN